MNPGWSFRDRAFLSALGLSLLWHCFWFFSISITVVAKKPSHLRPKIVSLGPVLDDTLFRTLVENKTELSETFYRRLSDFSKPVELEVKTMERHAAGEVVSLPFGKRVLDSIRSLAGGTKASPETEFASRLSLGYSQGIEGLEGEVKDRPVVDKPEVPKLPGGFRASLTALEVVFDFSVDPAGFVSEVEMVTSSGNRAVDALWAGYLKGWRFKSIEPASTQEKGRIHFYVG